MEVKSEVPQCDGKDGRHGAAENCEQSNQPDWVSTEDVDIKEHGIGLYDELSTSNMDAFATEVDTKEHLPNFEAIYLKQETFDVKEIQEVVEDQPDTGATFPMWEMPHQPSELRFNEVGATINMHKFLTKGPGANSTMKSGTFSTHIQCNTVGAPNMCETCGRSFSTRSTLSRHMGTHMKPYECTSCSKAFATEESMNLHARRHSGKGLYTCDVCKTSFVRRNSLVQHLKLHKEPIKCVLCNETFESQSNYTVHMGGHRGESPYPCDACSKRFSTHSELLRHLKTHSWKMKQPVKCETCGMMFLRLDKLTTHTRLHTGERPYPCHTCGERFTDHRILSNHAMTHIETKPFVCITCGEQFAQSSKLTIHLNTHRVQESLNCKVCGDTISIGNFAAHLKCNVD